MKRDTLTKIREIQADRIPATLVTKLENGAQWLGVDGEFLDSDFPRDPDLAVAIDGAMVRDKGQIFETETARYFIQPFNPAKRMLIVGAVHISQALAPIAKIAGYDVTVIDPRTAWATDGRFPNIRLDKRWPDEAMEESRPDRGTAVVTLTHDPKIDDPALEVALRSDAFYIGCLGSKRTHTKRIERLKEAGLTEDQIGKIHAPIGLDLGSVSPAEIAVATLAEVTLALRGPRRKD